MGEGYESDQSGGKSLVCRVRYQTLKGFGSHSVASLGRQSDPRHLQVVVKKDDTPQINAL